MIVLPFIIVIIRLEWFVFAWNNFCIPKYNWLIAVEHLKITH